MRATTTAERRQTALDATAVRTRARQPYPGLDGVEQTTLWSAGDDHAGVLWMLPGSGLPEHTHEHAAHHVWVVSGTTVVDGRPLAAGSYWHIPPGCVHRIEAGPTGCELFYLYLAVADG